MLSIANVSIEQASTYYENDNYYTKSRGEFFGKSIKNLGFSKELTHKNFIKLLNGQNAEGEQLRRQKESGNTRAGYDHTFSAPKSLSILLEIAEATGDDKLSQVIRDAHNSAVDSSLSHIEDNYIYTRTRTKEGRVQEKTGNMIAAKFEHDTSRELDPTLHTHCVIANYTQDAAGNWKSLSNEHLYINKMSNGQYYRSELAANLAEIGFDISITDTKKGLFEIKEIDKSLISEFSKRAEQIKNKMQEMKEKYPNASETELKQFATLETRKSKKNVDRDKVYQDNLDRANSLVDTDALLKKFQIKNQKLDSVDIDSTIKQAMQIINDQESTFTKEDILKIAAKLNLGTVRASEIFEKIPYSSEIVNLDNNIFTTKTMQKIEFEIVEKMKSTQNTQEAISTTENIDNYIVKNASTMTKGQKEALNHILTTKDKIIGIQGDAGTGKTFMLSSLNDFLDKDKFELQGLAFTGKAASELEDQSGIKSTTLHSFLNQKVEPTEKQKIYVVDEASLIGSKQISELIKKSEDENARIVLVGDTKQFTTIAAGSIFDQLQQKGMSTTEMTETLRQKTQLLKEVVSNIKTKNTDLAFDLLEDNNSIQESKDIVSSVIEEWKKDNDALIISSTNKIRNEVNKSIRAINNLQDEQELTVRESNNLIGADQFFAQNYKEDQIVFINKNIPSLKPGTEAIISNIDIENQQITLKYSTKKEQDIEKIVDISKHGDCISSYHLNKKSFAPGEKIMFTKNDKMLKVKNGETAIITSIDPKGNIVAKIENKEVKFNIKQYQYLDYGYSTTDYKAQGATANSVIIAADARMANSNSFYVQVTRAKNSVKVITDNLEILKEKVKISQEKTTTLLDDLKSNQEPISKSTTLTQNIKSKLQEVVSEKLQNHIEEIQSIKETNVKTNLLDNLKSNQKVLSKSTELNMNNQVQMQEILTQKLLQNIEEIKLIKEHINGRTINQIDTRAFDRDDRSTENNLRAATAKLRDIGRNLRETDGSTIRGNVAERLSEREFRDNKISKGDSRDLKNKVISMQKEIKQDELERALKARTSQNTEIATQNQRSAKC